MTSDPTDSNISPEGNPRPPRRAFGRRRLLTGAALVAVLVVGAAAGAVAMNYAHHRDGGLQIPLAPVTISSMTDWSTVAVKGDVAEIFGNKFIIEDKTGRALVETGPAGEDAALVARDETVTVQGRFEHGFLHAAFIVHGDGRVVQLEPPHAPGPHPALEWLRHLGAAAELPNRRGPQT